MSHRTHIALALITSSLASGALAQDELRLGELQRVDGGVADISPLSASFREMTLDFRQPTEFEHVYRVGGLDDYFMRAQGGLFAVFPQSSYIQTSNGNFVVAPPDMRFVVGRGALDALVAEKNPQPFHSPMLVEQMTDLSTATERIDVQAIPARAFQSSSVQALPGAIDMRAGVPQSPDVPSEAAQPLPPVTQRGVQRLTPPAIVDDPTYRRARVHELMQRAVHAARTTDT